MSWADDPRYEPRKLGDSLEHLVRSLGAPSVAALDRIFGNWPSVVGEAMAAHSRPVKLEGETLTVAVDDGVWASQLRWMTSDVLAAIEREIGEAVVTGLVVRVAPSSG